MRTKALVFALFIMFRGVSSAITGYVLLEDIGARGAGLAGACTSFTGDITLLRYNPASIADLQIPQLSTMYYNSGSTGMNFGSITYGQKMGIGVLGINLSYMDGGAMDLNSLDGTSVIVSSEQDIMGSVTFGLPLGNKLGIGASLKALSSTLIGSKNALTFAFDAGAFYKGLFMEELNAGISILNLGTGLKYLDTTESLPFVIQGGVSYLVNGLAQDLVVVVAMDGVINGDGKMVKLGIEGNYQEYAVRIGVPFLSTDDQSFSFGLGYRMEEQYIFDYGVSFGKSLGLTHRISVGILLDDTAGSRTKKRKTENNQGYTPGSGNVKGNASTPIPVKESPQAKPVVK